MGRKVQGVGINDMKGKWHCGHNTALSFKEKYEARVYKLWSHILERCYSEAWLSRNVTYRGCQVCVRWRRFSNFIKDLPNIPGYQYWVNNPNQRIALDKDSILKGNKLYHPKLVKFISIQDNSKEVHSRVDLITHLHTKENRIKQSYSQKRRVYGLKVSPPHTILIYNSPVDAQVYTANSYKFKSSCISAVCRGIDGRSQHKGFKWRYLKE